MSENTLIAEPGRQTGSGPARRLRADDKIPAVVYGRGMEPVSVQVEQRELRSALSGPAGLNTILDLQVGDQTYSALVKDIQRHPVRKTVQHVDFIQIDLNAEIVVTVPVQLDGEPKAVLSEGGLVEHIRNELEISTTPRNIPDEIIVDISEMTMDTTITIGDLQLPAGVTPTEDPERVVVTATFMAAAVADEAAAESDETTEGDADGDAGADAADADEGGDE